MQKKNLNEPVEKRVKDYDYLIAGIPAVISEVILSPYHDDWIAEINHFEVHRILAREVSTKSSRLTGNEVRFLRQWLMLNMADFASAFDYTAPAIHKWERRGDKPAGMMWSAEVQLRLLMLDQLGVTPAAFRAAFRKLSKPLPEAQVAPIRIPGSKVATKSITEKAAQSAPNPKTTTQSKRAA